MKISRREFMTTSAGAASALMVGTAGGAAPSTHPRPQRPAAVPPAFDPWLEIDGSALRHNVAAVASAVGGRPIIAVVKNNAYGLAIATAGPILDLLPEISGFAVVRPGEAIALREAGVKKPILLMGPASDDEAVELARRGVRLSAFTDQATEQLARVARRLTRSVPVQVYLDTGMNRMGLPVGRALPWIERLAALKAARIEGAFTELTEDS